jgi:hypothetical protein
MKLFISVLLLLPTFAFAAAKVVTLKLEQTKDVNDAVTCIYTAEIALGDADSIKPFQLLLRQDDGSYALLLRPATLQRASNGQFFTRANSVKNVAKNQTCPASTELLLIQ